MYSYKYINLIRRIIINAERKLSPPSEWVGLYGDYLYSFALYRIQDEAVAQDLVQEALTAALKARNNFKGKSTEKTWITGILKYKILDYLRKKYKEPVLEERVLDHQSLEDKFDSTGHWETGPAEWKGNPEKLLEQKSFMDIIRKCLLELPERPAKALSLKEIDGETTEKICKVLNVTSTNCWVILHRARSLMRACIEKKWVNE